VANGDHSSPTVNATSVFVSYACETTYRFTFTGSPVWNHTSGCSGGGGRTAVLHRGPPWLVRSVPVDGVDFAMWFTTPSQGFAAVLDHGPVVLTAWGPDPDIWDWHLTAVPPSTIWQLISEALDD
jgi:hypothetical protein